AGTDGIAGDPTSALGILDLSGYEPAQSSSGGIGAVGEGGGGGAGTNVGSTACTPNDMTTDGPVPGRSGGCGAAGGCPGEGGAGGGGGGASIGVLTGISLRLVGSRIETRGGGAGADGGDGGSGGLGGRGGTGGARLCGRLVVMVN